MITMVQPSGLSQPKEPLYALNQKDGDDSYIPSPTSPGSAVLVPGRAGFAVTPVPLARKTAMCGDDDGT